ncbi:MAG: Cu(I)-responsive transcriptional regulator [Rhizobiales bacterium]|nr:Cu(I)-responsive transcriptional regulator [Hyphomicrobiales bacterium]
MNIQQAATASGLTVKTVRYYDDIGIMKADRRANGYRDYSAESVHKLAFLQRARSLGFSVDDCRQLMSLYDDKDRASADVKALAQIRIDDINRKLAELNSLKLTLTSLVTACKGDDRPDCPILEDLAGGHQ